MVVSARGGAGRCFHGCRLGRAGFRPIIGSTRVLSHAGLRGLSRRVHGGARLATTLRRWPVLRGALALELYRRHPTIPAALVLAAAYAAWSASLPPAVLDQRLP